LHDLTSLHSKNVVQQYCCVFLAEVKPQWTAHPSPALANLSVASQDTTHVIDRRMTPGDSSCHSALDRSKVSALTALRAELFDLDRPVPHCEWSQPAFGDIDGRSETSVTSARRSPRPKRPTWFTHCA